MMRMATIILLLLFAFSPLLAQQKAVVKGRTNKAALNKLSAQLHQKETADKAAAIEAAKKNGWAIRKELDDGRVAELQALAPNGMPMYLITENLNAAQTVSTDEVWSGGALGLNLTGTGRLIGEWDGGMVLDTHDEFNGRVTQQDGATTLSDHATHVAGTMIATGVDASARGMASGATIDAYDFNSDDTEMTDAAANGLTLSNHSYGFVTGWIFNWFGDGLWAWFGDPAISELEDYSFGFYSSASQGWDQIVEDAPGYLIVKSAGNDRNDAGPASGAQSWVFTDGQWTLVTVDRNGDGSYDCISGQGISKNVLTVGAVNDIVNGYSAPGDVIQSSFSGWGPADDGRIKPDIVANGVGLFSSFSTGDSDYGTFSGTSMSAPNTTGSLALLQEHYANTHNSAIPLAATLKAIVIHTADEAGSFDGPDYQNGWGLLNTETAAQLISDNGTESTILESNLAEAGSFSTDIVLSEEEDIIATVVWTDPAGTPVAAALDPTDKMLVNDLDLRITGNNTTYFPWGLSAATPTAAATQGDNITDNVERIDIANAPAGTYTLTITHKGILQGGSQNFSLIISSPASTPPPPPSAAKWEEIFNTTVQPTDWQVIDNDGSGTFMDFRQLADFGTSGVVGPQAGLSFWFSSFNNANGSGLIDEWLISPLITSDDNCDSLFFYAGAVGGSFDDSLKVFISTTGNTISDFTDELDYFRVDGPTGTWTEYGFDIAEFAGDDFYIAVNYYIVNGGANGSNSDNVWIDHFMITTDTTVVAENTAPTVASAISDQTVNEDFATYVVADLDTVFDDAEDDVLTFSVGIVGTGTATLNLNNLELSATPDSSGTATITVTADDGEFTVDDIFTLTVNAVNDPPVVDTPIADFSIDEDSGVFVVENDLDNVFSDIDDETLTYSASADTGLAITVSGNELSVTPNADFNGAAELIVTADDGDATTSDTVSVTVNSLNDAPILNAIPDVAFDEDSSATLDLTLYVSDVDDAVSELTFESEVTSATLKTANLKDDGQKPLIDIDDLTVTIDGNGLATFTSTADSAGQFTVVFTATDPGDSSDTDEITVTVAAQNDAPIVVSAIADLNIDEDSGETTVVSDLNTVFSDIDSDLTFSANGSTDLTATVSGNALSVTPAADFFGTVEVIVTADDGIASVSDSFQVTVDNINDDPSDFALLLPADNSTLGSLFDPVTFSWNAASDADGDALIYHLAISGPTDSTISSINDTTFTFTATDFWEGGSVYTWTVSADDGTVSVTGSSTFTINTPIVTGIDSEGGIPLDYVLEQNYPNPFNPSTQIRFGIPMADNVRLSVYNALGQEVAVLHNGPIGAGYHTVTFEARDLSSGLYFYRLNSSNGQHLQIRKMLLMK